MITQSLGMLITTQAKKDGLVSCNTIHLHCDSSILTDLKLEEIYLFVENFNNHHKLHSLCLHVVNISSHRPWIVF